MEIKETHRLKNSNPVTMRLLAPPAAGACVFPYPHILVTKLAYASVAPLRTSQCGDLKPPDANLDPSGDKRGRLGGDLGDAERL